MNGEHRKPGSIQSELDAAFATVQAARLRRELGFEDARSAARECVKAAAARLNRRLLKEPVSMAEQRLIEAKLKALIGAAARIPGPASAPEEEKTPRAAAAPVR